MKVTIIGASTPGLFAAYLLARAGATVEVYERSASLNFMPRTLIVTDKIIEVLGFVPHEAILNEVRYVELLSKSRTARLDLGRPDYIIEREKLLNMLARMATEAGARIILNRRFLNFTSLNQGVLVSFKNLETGGEGMAETDALIGADGTFSAVARAASYNGHFHTALLQARVPMAKGLEQDTYQVWFDPKRTKYFYWMIPESAEMMSVGLIADDARQAGQSLRSFLEEQQWKAVEFQAAMVPMHKYGYSSKVTEVRRGVYLIGDAAAQVKVTTVGGVVTGFRGARAVVEAILQGKPRGKESDTLKQELDLHLLVRRLLDEFTDTDYDRLIEFMDGKLKHVLAQKTRDELSQMYLKLIASQPRLMMLGAKAAVKSLL